MTKKKFKIQPPEEVLPEVTEKKVPEKRKHVKKQPLPLVDPHDDLGLAVGPKAVMAEPVPPKPPMTRDEHKKRVAELLKILAGKDEKAKADARKEIDELNQMVLKNLIV